MQEFEAPLFIPMDSSGDEYEGPEVRDEVSDEHVSEGEPEEGINSFVDYDVSPVDSIPLTGRLRSQQPGPIVGNGIQSIPSVSAAAKPTRRKKRQSSIESVEAFISYGDGSENENENARPKRNRNTSKPIKVSSESGESPIEEEMIHSTDFDPRSPPISKIKIPRTKIRQADMNWLLASSSIWNPYRPQLGDVLYYIKAGHIQFAADVEPFIKILVDHELPDVLLCKVQLIHFTLIPELVCDITLGVYPFLDFPEQMVDYEDTLPTLNIRWCQNGAKPDFLVLYNIFQDGVGNTFKMGDSVKIRYERCNVSAQVLIISELNTPWNRYQLDFQSVEKIENFSPWEVTSLDGKFSDLPKLEAFETQRLITILENALKDQKLEIFFNHAFNEIETYLESIAYPICIRLIHSRIKSNYYRQTEQVIWGIFSLILEWDLICQNARDFNGEDSWVTRLVLQELIPIRDELLGSVSLNSRQM